MRSERAPPAVAHVNPNQPGDRSGLGHVCAAGVTFLFLVALNRALARCGVLCARCAEPDLLRALDLVGLATVCDVVPLMGVNRAFVRGGLARLAKLARPGLAALGTRRGCSAAVHALSSGFCLRAAHQCRRARRAMQLGVDLLTAQDRRRSGRIRRKCSTLHNRERQAIEKLILDDAIALAAMQDNAPFLLVAGDGWHPGVVGIVAGRLKERFAKPAFVAGFEGGMGRGSARSIAGIDIGAIVRAAREEGAHRCGRRPRHGGGLFAAPGTDSIRSAPF